MTPFDPESRRDSKEEPVGLTGRVSHAARQRPPAPAGRGIAIAIIAGLAVVAAIYQIASGGGAGKEMLDRHEAEAKREEAEKNVPTPLAPRSPDTPGGEAAPAPDAPPEPAGVPLQVEVPPGLGGETAANLRLALGAIASGYVVGASDLPRLVASAREDERSLVRRTVVDALTLLAAKARTRGVALDAALDLAGDGHGGLTSLVQAATASVRSADEAAAEALVFLAHVSAQEGEPALDALVGLVRDTLQPLHLRVLAAGVLTRWGAAEQERKDLAGAAGTPKVLVEALGGD